MARLTLLLGLVLTACSQSAVVDAPDGFIDLSVDGSTELSLEECLMTTFQDHVEARAAGCSTCPESWFAGVVPAPELRQFVAYRSVPDGELVVRAVASSDAGVGLVLVNTEGTEHTISIGGAEPADLMAFEVGRSVFAETTRPDSFETLIFRADSGELLFAAQQRSQGTAGRGPWEAGELVVEADRPECIAYVPGISFVPLRMRMTVGPETFVFGPAGTTTVRSADATYAVRGFWLDEARTISRNGAAYGSGVWVARLPDD
ncbi:MAG: hypothetical protein AAGH15_13420 [Myxococcota bacterium]